METFMLKTSKLLSTNIDKYRQCFLCLLLFHHPTLFQKILRTDHKKKGCRILDQTGTKQPICDKKIYFAYLHKDSFVFLTCQLMLQNLKNILKVDFEI